MPEIDGLRSETSKSMATHDISPILLLACLGFLGAVAGTAALLRSDRDVNHRNFWSGALNSSLVSIGVATFMLWKFPQELWLTVSASVFSGLGGNRFVELAVELGVIVLTRIAEGKNRDE